MPSLRRLRKPGRPPRAARRAARGARLRQLGQAFTATRKVDNRLVPYLAVAGLGTLAGFVLLGALVGQPVFFTVLGVLFAALSMLLVFGRRAQASAYRQVEGQPGAAYAVLTSMRGGWQVTAGVAVDPKSQDLVHRAVGRPGVVLVGEGSAERLRSMIAAERRRTVRVLGDTPVYDVLVGDGEGEVPLRRLQVHLTKLPRNLKPAQADAAAARLAALGAARPPIPKGPLPRSARAVPRGRAR